jgi:ABC-type antimicrobial peptide transport system permease subunit
LRRLRFPQHFEKQASSVPAPHWQHIAELTAMFRHNLLIAFRNLRRHRGSFIINLVGLSTGLACALLIYLWVNDELSVDKFHKNDKELYQVMEISKENGSVTVHDGTQGPLAEVMLKDLPEVAAAVPVLSMDKVGMTVPLKSGEKAIKSSGIFAGKDFFKVFSFPIEGGKADQVLNEKHAMVLSQKLAVALFGSSAAAIGKSVEWEILGKKQQSVVSGVFKSPATNSMKFEFALTYDLIYNDIAPDFQKWWNTGPYTFVLLKKSSNVVDFNAKIENYIRRYDPETMFTMFVRPYSSAYLYGKYENGRQAGGRIEYVRLFSIVAVFILLIACINFMNLSTAKASRRLKEVGVKKAIGSTRKALIFQFLSEAIFMSLLSLLVACVLVAIVLPVFNSVTAKNISLTFDTKLVAAAFGIALLTGIVSGSYPAFYMSGFSVVSVFKGKMSASIGELLARKGLVVFQFMTSLVLIISVIVVYEQIKYVQSKNLGYNRENLIHFDKEGALVENGEAFLAELNKLPGVQSASMMQQNFFQNRGGSTTYGVDWPGKNDKEVINFVIRAVDFGLVETMGIEMKEGRSFSKAFGGEDTKLIFNETAIHAMGLKDPVGTKVVLWNMPMTIIGVVKDFHVSSFHDPILPLVYMYSPQRTSTVMVRLKPGNQPATIDGIAGLFKKFNPGFVFQYQFLDEDYQEQYAAEQRVSVLSRYFAGLAIIISCLGLLGLAAFNAEVRAKEIGIRKVLGASLANVMLLLSKDFIRLIIIAMLVAFPLAWWMMNVWLDGFVYRVHVEGWVFVVAGAAMIVLAGVTVGYQSLKTGLMNPVNSLRSE